MQDLQLLIRDIVKSFSAQRIVGMVAGVALPTLNRSVDIYWIEFDAATAPPCPLGGD
jgi:hypothetical protein